MLVALPIACCVRMSSKGFIWLMVLWSLSWPERHGGKNVGPLVMLHCQETEREMNAQLDFAFFIQPGTPVHGLTPPTFRVGLPIQLIPNPGNFLQTHSEMYLLDGSRFNQRDNED